MIKIGSLCSSAIVLFVLWSAAAPAEQLVFERADQWQQWNFPSGALEIVDGRLQPLLFRKDINSAAQGIVLGVGSSPAAAAAAFDGDFGTAWVPAADAAVEEQWIEIDLGQVLPTRQIRFRFDPSTAAPEFFKISLSKGERPINSANVLVEGALVYNAAHIFSFNEEHLISIDLEDEPVRIVRFEIQRQGPLPRLVEVEVDALGDNIAFDLLERGGSVDVDAEIVAIAGSAAIMFDGDLTTAWRVNPLAKGSSGGKETFGDYRIDLGATYWMDTLWLLGEPLGIPPRLRQNYANFLAYEILYSNGSLATDGSLEWTQLASVLPASDNLFERRNFSHRFDPIAARYLRLRYPTSEGGAILGGGIDGRGLRLDGLGLVGEFQVFGQGRPAQVKLVSPVIDLGDQWNITSLEWQAEIPEGAAFRVRSRSGDQIEELTTYFDNKGKEITQRRWDKLIKSFRGPVVTSLVPGAGWSAWSEEYTVTGSLFRSPSPRQYFQLDVELLSDEPEAGVLLEQLTVNYSRPLAATAVGEVVPAMAEPGIEQEFSYFLRSQVPNGGSGFERIVLQSSVPMQLHQVLIDGQSVEPLIEAGDAADDELELRLVLPEPVRGESLAELRFAATIFQNNTRFRAFLERGKGQAEVRQRVDPGNAAPDSLAGTDIVSLPVDAELIVNLAVGTAFTPNGDGVNDVLRFSFDVLKLLAARPVRADIFDLQGRLWRRLGTEAGTAGHYTLEWDGRDEGGRLAPPGIYLVHLEVGGDARSQTAVRAVGLAY
jgi:hypothetical protein